MASMPLYRMQRIGGKKAASTRAPLSAPLFAFSAKDPDISRAPRGPVAVSGAHALNPDQGIGVPFVERSASTDVMQVAAMPGASGEAEHVTKAEKTIPAIVHSAIGPI